MSNTSENIKMDDSVLGAIENFFSYGLNPGKCTEHLLRGNYDTAYIRAHELIQTDETWEGYINFIELCVPICCRGENYDNWKGYAYLNEDDKLEIKVIAKLSCKYMGLAIKWMDKHLEGEFVA